MIVYFFYFRFHFRSNQQSIIFNQIKDKINKHAFSGGQETLELQVSTALTPIIYIIECFPSSQRRLGANLAVDVPYEWLRYFLESDERYEEIGRLYSTGGMLTGEVKKELISLLTV